ncbi:25S rRNA adenine-N(1) methyltransferase [Mycena kentingensis (nom. inval.)]|nr:25S rRNA adenine-N(1) methyltransferase [Mycena kentingensis (nom. inval.)]
MRRSALSIEPDEGRDGLSGPKADAPPCSLPFSILHISANPFIQDRRRRRSERSLLGTRYSPLSLRLGAKRTMSRHNDQFTQYGWLLCLWILVISFQYGWHISVLNQLQAVLTCEEGGLNEGCIPMSEAVFGLVTAVFTVGGLAGSLVASMIMDNFGRRGTARVTAILIAVGSGLMGFSHSVAVLGFGRLLVGLGSGIGLCAVPIYLAEIAPPSIAGRVGVLNQLGIVVGIMVTQAVGLRFATPSQWRYVLFMSSALSLGQFFVSSAMVESPAYLASKGLLEQKKAAAARIWKTSASPASVEDPLLADQAPHNEQIDSLTVPEAIAAKDIRGPLVAISFAMVSQQLSGINAVLYYSNSILSKSLPNLGPYVSLGITVVNVIMTFPPILLIERVGRRRLLYFSTFGAVGSLMLVGLGLNTDAATLSSIAILTFVTSFASGLGPVPFVLIPEIAPQHAVSALSSIALSLNWSVNFLVGLAFLPLRQSLQAYGEGTVFFVFAAALLLSMTVGFRTADKGSLRRGQE